MAYTLDGITLESKRTPSGIGYWQYGNDNLPTVVFLHGIGERGSGNESDLMKIISTTSPVVRQWINGGYNAWAYKDIFSKGIRILTPQLPSSKSAWDIAYIDSFLDAVHTNQPLFLMGYSLGGGGALRYAAQQIKKHKLTCFAGIASAISPVVGTHVDVPYFFAHSTNDSTVHVSNTDNYVAAISDFDNTMYSRGNGGGHWYYTTEAFNSPVLYDWFLSLSQPVTMEPKILVDEIYLQNGLIHLRFGNEIKTL